MFANSVTKAVVTMYVGPNTCADVARRWGVQPGTSSLLERYSSSSNTKNWLTGIHASHKGKSSRGVDEGRRAGVGVLRWARKVRRGSSLSASTADYSFPLRTGHQSYTESGRSTDGFHFRGCNGMYSKSLCRRPIFTSRS